MLNRTQQFRAKYFPESRVHLSLGDLLNSVVPFSFEDERIRNAIDDQHRPGRIAFVSLAPEALEYLVS